MASPGYMWLEDALEAGLLYLIVTCATLECAGRLHPHLRYLLGQIIPAGLIYYNNVLQVEASLEEVDDLVQALTFQTCELFEDWSKFVTIVNQRLDVVSEMWKRVALTACDNLESLSVAKLARRNVSDDAVDASHSIIVVANARDSIGSTEDIVLPVAYESETKLLHREREFLRALIQHDYQTHLQSICAAQIDCMAHMAANLGCDVVVTLFDYSTLPLKIEVHSGIDSALATRLLEAGDEWVDMVARAARSNGRLDLHVIKVLQGQTKRHWVVPLRTTSSNIHDGLWRLLTMAPVQDTDVIERELAPVLEDALQAIH
ncbi:hypothetical protein B0H11DRAFT_2308406 [Mycena galericulata]|nr:hypothetical protein B0H11DRAFT_2308406 [Mycena galericulata]